MLYGTVLCLGDSLTRGARSYLGPPEYLADLLSRDGPEWSAINAGVCAETTRQILDRARIEVPAFAALPGPKWCVIWAGTNDSKGQGIPAKLWTGAYMQLARWPRRYGIPTVLCTLPPVVPHMMPAFRDASVHWIGQANAWIRDYGAKIGAAVAETSALPTDVLCDGVHLSEEGCLMAAHRIYGVMRGGGADAH